MTYSKDLRVKVKIMHGRKGMTLEKIADITDINHKTVKSMVEEEMKEDDDNLSARGKFGGKKLGADVHKYLSAILKEEPSLSLIEMCELVDRNFNAQVSTSTMSRFLRCTGVTRKKLHVVAKERDAGKERKYVKDIEGFLTSQFVFIDETHTDNRNRNRRWGWAPRGQRASERGEQPKKEILQRRCVESGRAACKLHARGRIQYRQAAVLH